MIAIDKNQRIFIRTSDPVLPINAIYAQVTVVILFKLGSEFEDYDTDIVPLAGGTAQKDLVTPSPSSITRKKLHQLFIENKDNIPHSFDIVFETVIEGDVLQQVIASYNNIAPEKEKPKNLRVFKL